MKHEFNTVLKGECWMRYWRQRQQLAARMRRVRWPSYAGTRGVPVPAYTHADVAAAHAEGYKLGLAQKDRP